MFVFYIILVVRIVYDTNIKIKIISDLNFYKLTHTKRVIIENKIIPGMPIRGGFAGGLVSAGDEA